MFGIHPFAVAWSACAVLAAVWVLVLSPFIVAGQPAVSSRRTTFDKLANRHWRPLQKPSGYG